MTDRGCPQRVAREKQRQWRLGEVRGTKGKWLLGSADQKLRNTPTWAMPFPVEGGRSVSLGQRSIGKVECGSLASHLRSYCSRPGSQALAEQTKAKSKPKQTRSAVSLRHRDEQGQLTWKPIAKMWDSRHLVRLGPNSGSQLFTIKPRLTPTCTQFICSLSRISQHRMKFCDMKEM